ncbi:hypothetical protein DFH09DRAFT_1084930 [Mycena vulgaris]|nr:hypothetical protein DFH09DRAFT_1084930 [Mycena vulgaris]
MSIDLYSHDTVHYLYDQAASPLSADVSTVRLASLNLLDQFTPFVGAFLVALCALLTRIITNCSTPKCLAVRLDVPVAFKALFGVVYVAATVTMLVDGYKANLVLGSAAVATAITFVGASISQHYHSVAPSTLTSLYAIVAAAFYAFLLRDFYDAHLPSVFVYADAAIAGSLFVLIFLESTNKRSLLLPTDPPPAYESTLSFLVKPFFPHIVPILFIGARRRIKLPELRDIPLHLRLDPATEKLLAALAVEDSTSDRYLAKGDTIPVPPICREELAAEI